jgi:hypothetical protein
MKKIEKFTTVFSKKDESQLSYERKHLSAPES